MELPQAFRDRMKRMLGEEQYRRFLASYDRPRALSLRVNPLKITDSALLSLFPGNLSPVPWAPHGFYYGEETASAGAGGAQSERIRPGRLAFHDAGLYYMQEASAMAVAALSGARPGERILDLCAAPGGKTTQLAGMMDGEGLLVSNEIDPGRARILSQNVERMGIRNAVVTNMAPADLASLFPSFFDRIIVDAPCSGEGMFRKEEQALSMWSQENVETCAKRQEEILESACVMLRSGGTLIYSTCTFAPEEDEGSIAHLLMRHPELSMEDLPAALGGLMAEFGFSCGCGAWCSGDVPEEIREEMKRTVRLWPQNLRGEGHFLAALNKADFAGSTGNDRENSGAADLPGEKSGRIVGDAGNKNAACLKAGAPDRRGFAPRGREKKKGRGQSLRAAQEQGREAFLSFAEEALTPDAAQILVGKGGEIVCFGEDVSLLPCALPLSGLRVLRPGLALGTMKKNRFEPSHALALTLRREDCQRSVSWPADSQEIAAFLHGVSIPCDPAWKGWYLVCTDGYSLGWAKAAGGMLKNHYPKGLRTQY